MTGESFVCIGFERLGVLHHEPRDFGLDRGRHHEEENDRGRQHGPPDRHLHVSPRSHCRFSPHRRPRSRAHDGGESRLLNAIISPSAEAVV